MTCRTTIEAEIATMIYGSFDRFHAAETDVIAFCIREGKKTVGNPHLSRVTIPGTAAENFMCSHDRSPGVFLRA